MDSENTLTVARVIVEAPVASFRYPHFLIARQPTFDMPPPSTIFGHIASALGEWPSFPIRFAYRFTSKSKCSDLEHQHVINKTSGKFPGDLVDPLWTPPIQVGAKKLTKAQLKPKLLEKTTEATVQPHLRDFLFDVRLELFVTPVELAESFRSPTFTVVLGRSQDLASVTSVDVITLVREERGYVENTILPAEVRRRLPWGVTTLMPRYIGPSPERIASFSPYIQLRERVFVGGDSRSSKAFKKIAGEQEYEWYADPNEPQERGGSSLLWFHTIDPAKELPADAS